MTCNFFSPRSDCLCGANKDREDNKEIKRNTKQSDRMCRAKVSVKEEESKEERMQKDNEG